MCAYFLILLLKTIDNFVTGRTFDHNFERTLAKVLRTAGCLIAIIVSKGLIVKLIVIVVSYSLPKPTKCQFYYLTSISIHLMKLDVIMIRNTVYYRSDKPKLLSYLFYTTSV